MEQKILKVGDVIEFNGKKYRAESEVKETPRRHIELGVVKVEGIEVTFRIVEQTHRCGDFSQQSGHQYFKASNGTELASRAFPEWKGNYPLSCRGCVCGEDDKELTCTAAEFALISEAVSEYNATDGKGYEKPWPQTGDRYFFISGDITPGNLIFTDCAFDHNCQTCCNIFRTYEEAVAAADKVRMLLKELAAK
ncbi:hypothetical protein [Victivallis vadensis]|uniref:hypothetical protein n=1 Tax=Victivallis vadensis TaxID=172901 RepID=UPI003AF65059